MSLLDRLDAVDWARLHHAYGPATDVPELLRGLVHPEGASETIHQAARKSHRSVREHIEWTLWGNIYHQGTVWQATAKTIPSLVEILQHGPDVPELYAFVLTYLNHLALGYPEDLFPARIDLDKMFAAADGLVESRIADLLDRPYDRLDESERILLDRSHVLWARQCYSAVQEAVPTLAQFIEAGDERVALEAMALTASFPRASTATVQPLRAQARACAVRKANAVVVLARLLGRGALEDAESALDCPEPLVALHGACARVMADPERTCPQAIAVLTRLAPELHAQSSPLCETVGTLVARCLALVPDHDREPAVEAMARQHETANALVRLSLTSSMLTLVLGQRRAPVEARQLTALQRRAMEVIRDHGGWTLGDGLFSNYALLLHHWGLPDEREAFVRWLG